MAFRKVNDDSLATVAAAIRAKGGTSEPLAFPDGFVSAVDAIQAGVGSLDHSVTFKDDSGNVVAVYSVIDGIGGIYPPTGVEASKWVCDGTDITFPITPSSDMTISAAISKSLVDALYEKYVSGYFTRERYPIFVAQDRGGWVYFWFFQSCGMLNASNMYCQNYYGAYFEATPDKTPEALAQAILDSDATVGGNNSSVTINNNYYTIGYNVHAEATWVHLIE